MLQPDNQLSRRLAIARKDWDEALAYALTAHSMYDHLYGKLTRDGDSLTFEFLGVKFPVRTRPVILDGTDASIKVMMCHPDDDKPPLAAWTLINGDLVDEPFKGGEKVSVRVAKPNWDHEHARAREPHNFVQLLATIAAESPVFSRYQGV